MVNLTSNRLKKVLIFAVIFLTTAGVCFAEGGYGSTEGTRVLDEVNRSLSGMMTSFVSLLKIVLGIGALITLVMVIFNIFKGEREAAQKMAWWVVGLSVGFALIAIVPNLAGASGF